MIPEVKEVNGKFEKWMTKGKYYIRTCNKLVETEGYIDKENNIAYSDDESLIWNENKWTATDINTGLQIANGNTLEIVYNKIQDMKTVITERKKTSDYNIFVNQFKMIIAGSLGDIVPLEQEYI